MVENRNMEKYFGSIVRALRVTDFATGGYKNGQRWKDLVIQEHDPKKFRWGRDSRQLKKETKAHKMKRYANRA